MEANFLKMSIEFFGFYQEIMELTILKLNNCEPVIRARVGKGMMYRALRCNSQLKNIIIFLKLARALSRKIDEQTINRMTGDTELWVDGFKKFVDKRSYKSCHSYINSH